MEDKEIKLNSTFIAEWTMSDDLIEDLDPEDIEIIVRQIEEDLINHILETK
jgi:hypothetical protein